MSTKLYVGNLSFDASENDIQDLFSQHGPVTEVNLIMDKMTGRARGFGFVTMGTADGFEEYRRADVRFHIGVAEAAHSPRLVTAMTGVQGQMSDLIARIAHPDAVLMRSNAQHRRLVALLRRREAGRAVRCVREHIEGTEHILAGLMPDRGAATP